MSFIKKIKQTKKLKFKCVYPHYVVKVRAVKRIPRGLRTNKGPFLGREDEAFCTRWTEILNLLLKCSFDLIAVTI